MDLKTFNQLSKGEHVELHVLEGNQVFKVVPFTVKPVFQSEILRTDKLDEKYQPILKKLILRRLFFYALLGFIGVRILLFIAQFFIVILMKDTQRWSDLFQLANLLALFIYLVLNWKTFQLVRDWFSKMQVTESDLVVDLLKSNLPKSSKNSIHTYQGYWYKNDTFYYVQTTRYWIQISESHYEHLNNGASIQVVRLMHSKLVLEVEK